MNNGLKYLLRCVGLYIITFVVFCGGFSFFVEFWATPAVLFIMCMWVFEILQIVNCVKGVGNCSSEKWNIFIEVLFVILSLCYILFCGLFVSLMSLAVLVELG